MVDRQVLYLPCQVIMACGNAGWLCNSLRSTQFLYIYLHTYTDHASQIIKVQIFQQNSKITFSRAKSKNNMKNKIKHHERTTF